MSHQKPLRTIEVLPKQRINIKLAPGQEYAVRSADNPHPAGVTASLIQTINEDRFYLFENKNGTPVRIEITQQQP